MWLLDVHAPSGQQRGSAIAAIDLPLALLFADREGRVRNATSEFLRAFECGLSEVCDDGWLELIHPVDLVENRRALARALAGGRPGRLEFRLARDPARWVEVRVSPAFGDGTASSWCLAFTDITEHVATEAERAALDARLRAALESTPDAAALLEAVRGDDNEIEDFRWVAANQRARDLIAGLTERDEIWLEGLRLSEVLPSDVARRELEALRPLVERHESAVFTEVLETDARAATRLTTTAVPVLDGLYLVRRAETDTEAQERRLVASEERLRLALDGSRDAVWD
jgi:PAS domain S-box-containing protein